MYYGCDRTPAQQICYNKIYGHFQGIIFKKITGQLCKTMIRKDQEKNRAPGGHMTSNPGTKLDTKSPKNEKQGA